MRLLLRWILNALALLGLAYIVPGIAISGWYAALITVLILGLVNALIRPLCILLTLPLTIVTLGLSTLVINGLLFWFVSTVVKGFDVAGFVPAFVGALVMTIVSWVLSVVLKRE